MRATTNLVETLVLCFSCVLFFYPYNLLADGDDPVAVVQVASSRWYPYIYMDGGVPAGKVYKLAEAVLKSAQQPFQFRLLPWARVYDEALTSENYLVLGIGRTPLREKKFKWIGPVQRPQTVFYYSLSTSLIEASRFRSDSGITIGVQRNTYMDEYLMKQDVQSKVLRVRKPEQLLKMIQEGRLDLVVMQKDLLVDLSQQLGIKAGVFRPVEEAFSVAIYMALSSKSSDSLAKRLRLSYQKLQEEGGINLK